MSAELPHFRFIERLARLPFVEAIYLFGSRARGDNAPRADIDLAIFCPSATRAQWHEVLGIVEDADTLLEVDCIRLDEEAPGSRLRANIEREGKIIHARSGSAGA